jgi:hypothetical protein
MPKSRLLFAALALFLSVGCSSFYTTIRQTPMGGNLKAYPFIAVGWLDLGEQRYQEYGYSEQDKGKWFTLIQDMNHKTLPETLNNEVGGKKKVHVAKSKVETLPADGLVVIFTDVNYKQQTSSAARIFFGSMAGSDALEVTVHFIDGKSQRELYAETISLTSEGGYSSWAFDGRVNTTVYNLARYIAEKIE